MHFPFGSQNRLEIKPVWGSTLFGDPKLPLNFGVILGGFFCKDFGIYSNRLLKNLG